MSINSQSLRNYASSSNGKNIDINLLIDLIETHEKLYNVNFTQKPYSTTLSFDKNFNFLPYIQIGNIILTQISTGNLPNIQGVIIINGDSSHSLTLPSLWIGNGTFDNTKRNYITLNTVDIGNGNIRVLYNIITGPIN